MKAQSKTMSFQVSTLAALLVGVWVVQARPAGAQTRTSTIVGAWTLNNNLSDSPQRGDERGDSGPGGGQGRGGRRGGGFGRGGGGGRGGYGGDTRAAGDDMRRSREALRDIMAAPERLTITETSSMVIITTGEGRTTRLSPDGQKIKDESTKIERKTRWDGGKLVSEISGAGGGKITETYSADPEHHQLHVTLHVENSRMPNSTDVHRVYELAP
jgi:hypothetical protein